MKVSGGEGLESTCLYFSLVGFRTTFELDLKIARGSRNAVVLLIILGGAKSLVLVQLLSCR